MYDEVAVAAHKMVLVQLWLYGRKAHRYAQWRLAAAAPLVHGTFAPMPLYVGNMLGGDRPVLIPPYLEIDVHAYRAGGLSSVIILLITVNGGGVKIHFVLGFVWVSLLLLSGGVLGDYFGGSEQSLHNDASNK